MCVCVCVSERERERERESSLRHELLKIGQLNNYARLQQRPTQVTNTVLTRSVMNDKLTDAQFSRECVCVCVRERERNSCMVKDRRTVLPNTN